MFYQPDIIVLFWLFPVIVFFLIPLACWGIHSVVTSLQALAGKEEEIYLSPAMEPFEA